MAMTRLRHQLIPPRDTNYQESWDPTGSETPSPIQVKLIVSHATLL